MFFQILKFFFGLALFFGTMYLVGWLMEKIFRPYKK